MELLTLSLGYISSAASPGTHIHEAYIAVRDWVVYLSWKEVVLYSLLYLYLFFGLYILVMGLYRAHLEKALTKPGYVLGAPWLLLGALVDVLANLIIFPFIFLERPKEWLVTTRLRRHMDGEQEGFRYRFARAICKKLLNAFDPRGKHC
jgi:hypothetical protein